MKADPLVASNTPIVGPYDGLAYPSFDARADGVSIVRSHSPNNTATHTILSQGTAMITTNYTGSKIKYFDLYSTYLGCSVLSRVSVGVPQPCNILFNGTTTSGQSVSEICPYAGTLTDPALVQCKFTKLNSLKEVTVSVISSITLPDTTVEYLDNVVGILYSSS